ncbi:saccharopine dehydrogenase NADP-binding domain-containing protein [Cellulomonas phragmiteti]|uniref:Epimerase n=1 Tax=Cellulomonas phragmiteti TaxID=478780 RepID=A0ABQ4DMM2_9CELL|nr:saccharopine dehydrogenase NADP-binding domain-containing protein [Cellulomonas phragmiteti]GIG40586.1 epimerase [Cellulomonas phragmiteti]
MTPLPLVGVVGASGAVGSAAARALHASGEVRLRLGGRRPEPLDDLARELGGDAQVATADVRDAASLAVFSAGCDVVLGCAGPSYALGDRVARAALAAGADHVDVTGDEAVRTALAGDPLPARRRVVVSAGLLPGLSALLPRWLAARHGLHALRAYAGGLERCTPAAAGDLLLSLPGAGDAAAVFGTPGAAWRAGRVEPRALRSRDGHVAPHFDEPGFVQPFLTREAQRLAPDLGVTDLEWYAVHVGRRVREVLTAAAGAPVADLETTAHTLRRAADLDLAGRSPWYLLVLEATDADGGRRTLVLRTPDSYRLTGHVAAWTTREVLGGRVPTGVHHAADVLDPARAVDALLSDGDAATLREVVGTGGPVRHEVETGVL